MTYVVQATNGAVIQVDPGEGSLITGATYEATVWAPDGTESTHACTENGSGDDTPGDGTFRFTMDLADANDGIYNYHVRSADDPKTYAGSFYVRDDDDIEEIEGS